MPRKRSGGRTSKLTPEVQASIVQSVMAGVPQEQAAARAGITERTLYRWIRAGTKARSGVFCQFCQAIKKAHAERMAASVARIGRAAQGGTVVKRITKTVTTKLGTTTTVTEQLSEPQWTADAWFLERRHGEFFAANNLETKELRRIVTEMAKAKAHESQQPDSDPNGKTVAPKVGGQAKREAI